jgi:Lrp/AsnC family transcriptional regulator for asnA, asnC and gidA
MIELDEINKEILRLLCEDSRYQYTQLQKQLKKRGHKLTREAVEYRVKRMMDNGTIKKFAMITDPEKIGFQICIYFELNLLESKKLDEVGTWLASLPNTAYVHSGTSFFDLAARIFFKDTKHMADFLGKLGKDSRIRDFKFDIIQKTFKVGPIAPM